MSIGRRCEPRWVYRHCKKIRPCVQKTERLTAVVGSAAIGNSNPFGSLILMGFPEGNRPKHSENRNTSSDPRYLSLGDLSPHLQTEVAISRRVTGYNDAPDLVGSESCSKPYTSGRMNIAASTPIRGKIATKSVAAAWPIAVNRDGNRKIARKDGTLTKM